ncbi:MAG: HD domain-containing protein [Gemmataceae bacterium]|nr:HD domain-containing protein [Gemmataceae bacterium]
MTGDLLGQVWESDTVLRAGRLGTLEIVLDDSSVSRRHAEVRLGPDGGWVVRDLDSTNGTFVNGVRVGPGGIPLRPRDVVQFGSVAVSVEPDDASRDGSPSSQVVATVPSGYEAGLRRLAFDRHESPRPGAQLEALVRAGQHFVRTQDETELLNNILNDAVGVLAAQRGAVVLADGDGPDPVLKLRALAVGRGEPQGRFHYSKRLTRRAFARGESVLYSTLTGDDELKVTQSMHDGAMASVLCVLLRTPRRRLGVLHLDRGYWQNPFTEDDLVLADALAAHVSAGIEAAISLRRERDLFARTVATLAQAVELRDFYTGGHTQRVTRFAGVLAGQLDLPADQLELIRLGTPLHDIGKIGIDDAILRKPGRLTADEFAVMQSHTVKGAEILSGIPEMRGIVPIARSHHERWDGTGYPDRLAGEAIPLLARIVAVADAFDAMTSARPYHPDGRGRPAAEAFAELQRQAGRQFDPACVAGFLAARAEVERAMGDPSGAADETPPVEGD